jgi:hypothetical protein
MARFATVQTSLGDAINTIADKADVAGTRVASTITTANPTLTAAQMIGGVLTLSGQTAAQTVVTATAAAIVALIPDAQVGYGFDMAIQNSHTSSGTVALSAGAGVTLSVVGTAAQPITTTRLFRAVITNVATPAVTIYAVGQVA